MIKEKLWPHQINAIEIIDSYYDSFNSAGETGAALIQMPTGSGKSGIIAYYSRCREDIGDLPPFYGPGAMLVNSEF